MTSQVLIVGGGLSGLYLADQLQRVGIDYQLVEAADRFGGRILTVTCGTADFDLGPAWVWPGQPRIAALLERLNLVSFEQYSKGAAVFQDRSGAIQRNQGFASMQGSYRVVGGLGAVTAGLVDGLSSDRLHLNSCAIEASRQDGIISVVIASPTGRRVIKARQLVLAVPPRVAAGTMQFDPPLPDATTGRMANTATWMAGQAKVLAVYRKPYWRMAGFSGDAVSQKGPMAEIHDASPMKGGPHALFGFVGIPPQTREAHTDQIIDLARAQLVGIFGPELSDPLDIRMMDWAQNATIATRQDHDLPQFHPSYGMPAAFEGLWENTLLLSSTETAFEFGGFVEGALEASEATFAKLDLTKGDASVSQESGMSLRAAGRSDRAS